MLRRRSVPLAPFLAVADTLESPAISLTCQSALSTPPEPYWRPAEVVELVDTPDSGSGGGNISMMDGYAVRAADSGSPLRVVYEVAAGDPPPAQALGPREAARIFTGAPIPPGADCVVMQEQAERQGEEVRVGRAAAGQHIRRRVKVDQ